MSRTYIIRVNCEYSQQVTVRDDQDADDAMTIAHETDVADWDQAWSDTEADED